MTRSRPAKFLTTRWSIVNAAGGQSSSSARIALEELCRIYWQPVYSFVRRRGHEQNTAEDLTQAFFVHILSTDFVRTADRDRGRFRSFLLKSVSHFLSDQRRAAKALKRGGGQITLSLDFEKGERQYQLEPADAATAEELFERRWALTLLAHTTATLKQEYEDRNHGLLFRSLEPHLNQDDARVPYAELTETLDMSVDAIKQAARRLKLRYREILRAEIAGTVRTPSDIDDELRQLMTVLSR